MTEMLLAFSLAFWLPVFFWGAARQGFALILVWLLVAPVAVRVFDKPGANPFFDTEVQKQQVQSQPGQKIGGYLSTRDASITLKELLEPTRILFGVFFLVFLADSALKRRRLGPFDATEKFALIFSLLLIASALFQSKRSAYSLRVACDAFMIPFIAYFCARRLVRSEDQLRRFVRVIGYVGVYLIAIGLVERSTLSGFSRVHGPFEDRNALFILIVTVFFVVLAEWMRDRRASEKNALPRIVQQCVLVFAPVIVLLGWGRGNIVGLLSGVWIFLFLGRRLMEARPIMTLVGLGLLIGPILGLAVYELTPQEIVDTRIARPATIYARLGAWQNIFDETAKSPVFGIGFNNLRDILDQNRISIGGVKSETHAHNTPLSILAELGFSGLLVFAGLIGSMLQTGLKLYRTGSDLRECWRGIAVTSLVGAYLVGALFANSLYVVTVSHVYVYVFVGAVAGLYGKRRPVSVFSSSKVARPWLATESRAGV